MILLNPIRATRSILGTSLANYVQRRRHNFKRIGDRPVGEPVEILGRTYRADEWTNVPNKVIKLMGRQLYANPGNPIYLIAESLRRHFEGFTSHHFVDPVVDLWSNFDSILVPPGHISRSRTDTFYVDKDRVLRSHTSAHQSTCFRMPNPQGGQFLIIGDVFRRDEINRTHHAGFHQCEGAKVYRPDSPEMLQAGVDRLFDENNQTRTSTCQERHSQAAVNVVERELKTSIETYFRRMLGEQLEMRWVEGYFPFTHPSFELEIRVPGNGKDDEWLEMLGCGVVEQKILERDGRGQDIGWAFGIGLERLAMLFYSIPDIRLFWSTDSGFLVQFAGLQPFERYAYKPISSYPQKVFDLSFWLPADADRVSSWSVNDVHALVHEVGGDLVEQVHLVDQYQRPKDGRHSNTYRIVYRSHERALTNDEVNVIHKEIERRLVDELDVLMR